MDMRSLTLTLTFPDVSLSHIVKPLSDHFTVSSLLHSIMTEAHTTHTNTHTHTHTHTHTSVTLPTVTFKQSHDCYFADRYLTGAPPYIL